MDPILRARAAFVASARLALMREQLAKIMDVANAPQHKHADRVQKVLEEWYTEALLLSSHHVNAEEKA